MDIRPDNQGATNRTRLKNGMGAILGGMLFHATAVLVIFSISLWFFLGGGRVGMLVQFMDNPDFFTATLPVLFVHLAIAAVFWGVCFGSWSLCSRHRAPAPRSITTSRGTVITETIIALPVMFLLILGLSQLGINSAAGVLANLASYEAARTVWIWHPEKTRFDGTEGPTITDDDVRERARIQAAAVLTPVANSYGSWYDLNTSDEFRQLRGALLASQLDLTSADAGQAGVDLADDLAASGMAHYLNNGLSFTMAMDSTNFPVRSALKFSGAYVSTEVDFELDTNDDDHPIVTTELRYEHFQAVPLVGAIFGDYKIVGGRPGHFSTYEREFTLIQQVDSHPGYPDE